jgi:ribonuclease P protein component
VRNRIRRRVREIFRILRPGLRRGVWLVVIARQRAANATFEALEAEWRLLASRAGIFQAPCSS